MATDEFEHLYGNYIDDTYDCVDRIVLNAYFYMAQSGGGFRCWWRDLFGNDDHLDNDHLMRFAGRFSRRIHAFAEKTGIPLIHCKRGERKHETAEKYIPQDPGFKGLFCILAGLAQAPVREVKRCSNGQPHIQVKQPYPWVNHYFFHIIDPEWGHVVIRLCPHPPFNAGIILNGHEYVARKAMASNISFTKQGNCFTDIDNAADLARIADAMSDTFAVGRLEKVCERWIYSACLCFALTLDKQQTSGFHYGYSVYQAEYSRNYLFNRGHEMDMIFNAVIDRTRAPLDIKIVKTIFGSKVRPHRNRKKKPRLEAVVESPVWDLTVFKVHYGKLTVKIYSKGERVLRVESVAHNVNDLKCGRKIEFFPKIVAALKKNLLRFISVLRCLDATFISEDGLENLPKPSMVGASRVAGIDVNNPRIRCVMSAMIALAASPQGYTVSDLASKVREMMGGSPDIYSTRQAAYDLKKLKAKGFVHKIEGSRRNEGTETGLRAMAAIQTLREKVINPILAGCQKRKRGPKPKNWTTMDEHYHAIRLHMFEVFKLAGIATS